MLKTQKQNAITLLSLVITVIVLLIIVSVILNLIIGDNGTLRKAKERKMKQEISIYIERVEVAGKEVALANNRVVTLDNLIERIYKEEIVPRGNITKLNDEKAEMVTKEGYLFNITADTISYIKEVEPTGIWGALEGNTLKFYTEKEHAKNNGGKIYPNVKGKTFTRDNTDGIEAPTTPWFADRDKITAVEFVDEVAPEYLAYYFSDLTSLETVDMSKVKTINVKDMYGLFLNCRKLKEINTKGLDTRNVENMGWMFLNCSTLTNLDVTGFDTRKVTNMAVMFSGCSGLTQLDVSSFDTSKVTNMHSMFANMTKITELNLLNFDTSKVTDMSTMFHGCSSLKMADLSSFNTSNVTNNYRMFLCAKATIYIGDNWTLGTGNYLDRCELVRK